MAIKIKSLGVDKLSEKSLEGGYLYKDMMLDLVPSVSYNNQLNKREYLNDVAALYDEEAVKNSVANAFLTAPGQKILSPAYGMDIRRFLFEPIDDFIMEIMKDDIRIGLPIMEPRITISELKVTGDPDTNTYYISMMINVPSLNITGLSIKSELNSTGYTIL